MTDEPTRRGLLRGLTREAVDAGTYGEPAPRDPHPYVYLTYGPWEPSGHQCGDIQQGGCDDVIPERRVVARFDGVGEEHFVGWDLGDCPSCGLPGEPAPNSFPEGNSSPPPALRDQLAETLHCPTCGVEPGEHCFRARDDNLHPHMTRVQSADAVLPVVEAATAAKDAEIERLRERAEEAERDAKSAWQNAEDWHEVAQAALKRAEQVEERLARRHGEWQRELDARIKAEQRLRDTTRRAEEAERERDQALASLTKYAAEAHRRKWAHDDNQPAFDALHRLGNEILASRDRIIAALGRPEATP